MKRYILSHKTTIEVDDELKWAELMYGENSASNRILRQDTVNVQEEDQTLALVQISTVFIGIDMGNEVDPILFETMLFGSTKYDGKMWRYGSYDEAIAGHQSIKDAIEV
jgi:hypothetical protein